MALRAKPQDPFPTTEAVDRRLAEVAALLRARSLTDSYRATLRREQDQLLDRRLALGVRELVQTR